MPRKLKLSNNNGRISIRFNLNRQTHSLTWGDWNNPKDRAAMQQTLDAIESEIRWGTFEGLGKYRRFNVKATVGAAIEQLKQHPDYLDPSSGVHGCIKLLSEHDAHMVLGRSLSYALDASGLKANSKRQYLTLFRKYLPQWKDEFRIQVSGKGEMKSDRESFTSGEINAILWAFQADHYLPYIRFSLLTGCRPAEAYGIRWCDIDLEDRRIRFAESLQQGKRKGTKTGVVRYFPINDELLDLLNTLLNKSGEHSPDVEIFRNSEGEPMNARVFIGVWRNRLRNVIRYRPPYTMRHTFICNCLRKGIPVPTVAQWVGNSPEIIWKHYATYISDEAVPRLIE